MNNIQVYESLSQHWANWHKIKDTVVYFMFKDYVKGRLGFTYTGSSADSFQYAIVDEKKFMWFLLGGK